VGHEYPRGEEKRREKKRPEEKKKKKKRGHCSERLYLSGGRPRGGGGRGRKFDIAAAPLLPFRVIDGIRSPGGREGEEERGWGWSMKKKGESQRNRHGGDR